MADQLDLLQQAMQNGVVIFKFKKKDGTERVAVGTLKLDIIDNFKIAPYEKRYFLAAKERAWATAEVFFSGLSTGEHREKATSTLEAQLKAWDALVIAYVEEMENPKKHVEPSPTVFTYFDLQRGEFRCFNRANYIGMLQDYIGLKNV